MNKIKKMARTWAGVETKLQNETLLGEEPKVKLDSANEETAFLKGKCVTTTHRQKI